MGKPSSQSEYDRADRVARRHTIVNAMVDHELKNVRTAPHSGHLVKQLCEDKNHEFKPLELSRLVAAHPNPKHRANMGILAKSYEYMKEGIGGDSLGKHSQRFLGGDHAKLAEKLYLSPEALEKFGEAAIMDDVAIALTKRRGNDSDLPIPEMTRRDHIEAAIDAHSGED